MTDVPQQAEPVTADALVLPAELSIRTAARCRDEMAGAVLGGGDLRFDAGRVATVDTAGLQLLAAVSATLRQEGRRLEWSAVPESLRTAADELGLAEALGLPPAAATADVAR